MKIDMKRLITNSVSKLRAGLGFNRSKDYRTLSRFILEVTTTHDLDNILKITARCLKRILNYRLFAFAFQDQDGLDIWIDPSFYRDGFRDAVVNDFPHTSNQKVHQIDSDTRDLSSPTPIEPNDLATYNLNVTGCNVKLYLAPKQVKYHYQSEIIDMIIRTLEMALFNYISIKKLETEAAIDSLTGCYTRRELNRLINHHISNAKRHGKHLSVIMLDIDHFKEINDHFGHMTGDNVLKNVVKKLLAEIRQGDYLFRYGGDEFLILLPETSSSQAISFADRLRQKVAAVQMDPKLRNHPARITASFGVASWKTGWGYQQLFQAADEKLYFAKQNGRNMVAPALKLKALTAHR